MKSFGYLLITIWLLQSCQSNSLSSKDLNIKATDTANYTSIKWLDSLKDIGNVPAGKTATISFKFLNTGSKPLYVISVKPGCGCTLADYPKEPILPGKTGIVKANYNVHKDGQGDFRKNVRVTTNTKEKTDNYIFFYGTIVKDTLSENKTK